MKKITLFVMYCLVTVNMLVFNPNDRILGKWINEKETHIIEFVKTSHGYDAYIIQAENKSLNGQVQIENLQPTAPNMYANGTVHIFSRHKKIKCEARLDGNTWLYITGKSGFISKTQKWKRH